MLYDVYARTLGALHTRIGALKKLEAGGQDTSELRMLQLLCVCALCAATAHRRSICPLPPHARSHTPQHGRRLTHARLASLGLLFKERPVLKSHLVAGLDLPDIHLMEFTIAAAHDIWQQKRSTTPSAAVLGDIQPWITDVPCWVKVKIEAEGECCCVTDRTGPDCAAPRCGGSASSSEEGDHCG